MSGVSADSKLVFDKKVKVTAYAGDAYSVYVSSDIHDLNKAVVKKGGSMTKFSEENGVCYCDAAKFVKK